MKTSIVWSRSPAPSGYSDHALGHDASANLNAIVASTYTYIAENQLRTAPSEPNLVYAAFGNLNLVQSESTILRSVNGEVATEHDAATGANKNRYVAGAGTDEPLVWYGGSGTGDRHWLLGDERGSIVAVGGTTASRAPTPTNHHLQPDGRRYDHQR